jgi:four helix bundle protein
MKSDLQERLIDYAVRIIALSSALPATFAGQHIAGQILRSGTSPAPNYAEAVSSESRSDFIHKVQVALKELRETNVWLNIIQRAKLVKSPARLTLLLDETNELIAILVASVHTARRNAAAKKTLPT